MITQEFNLNLHAGHSIPLVIHVSQYEKNEQWLFTIINQDGTQYRPASASIVGTKSDGNLITNEATVDSNGRVVVEVTEQIAAAAGKAVFELRLDDQQHGTANFVVLVEKSPADGGVPSESDLSLIQRAIDGTSATAIAQGVSDWMDENLTPTTPVVDTSLTVSGAAADSAKVGQEISDLKSQIDQLEAIPHAVKLAMDTLFLKMGVKDNAGYTSEYATIHAWATTIKLLSISAVYTQSETIYDCDSLDILRSDLVVTATYDNGTTSVITGYTLSGDLTEGTSIITVSYEGKTTTFTVTIEHALFVLQSQFESNGTNYVDTGVAWEINKQYSLECTFIIDQFTNAGNNSSIGVIFGDTHGESTKYTALAEQIVTSGSTKGRYVWGSGLGWEASKNFVNTNQTVKFIFTFDVGTSGFTRNWYAKNVTANTSLNGTQNVTDVQNIKGYNVILGKQETDTGVSGFVGTISDLKIFERILTSEEITEYLGD